MLSPVSVSCIDELQTEVPYGTKPSSTPPQHPVHSSFAGGPNMPSVRSSSPPNSPSPSFVSVTESATSTTSDPEFPLTPNSNRSSGVCRISHPSVEAASPTPSPSPEDQHSDASRPHYSSSYEERIFDGLLDNLNCDQGTSESTEQQKVMEAYSRHLGQLSASSFHSIIRYLEAVRERQRMRYYTSCWDVVVVQRREAVALSARDKSESDFHAVERELRFVLDILSQRLSLPNETTEDSQDIAAARDKDRISISRTDTVLATLKSRANHMDDCIMTAAHDIAALWQNIQVSPQFNPQSVANGQII
ncbi:hypothetical protein DEU56DRAFT_929124 [Suillus clintonianus]|uniref:uncharacterized protein n=1 Tax=Suillus clintonianus TaxID=1904413 RepID=UPI001B86B752|nr:uncharacterized protein DEU56DRAFT_929124 [Suillus clintonianus]KAG2147494.1 hypothetical protein DEU56DRAFT_929124 [Suillus clintonianus]